MDELSFEAFGQKALLAAHRKVEAIHERYGLARAVRYEWDAPKQDAPGFRILDSNGDLLFGCVGLEVGTFDLATSSWKWSWANASLSDANRERLLPLRDLAEITGRAAFQFENPFETDLDTATVIAAIAAEHLGAAGFYEAVIKNLQGQELHAYLAYMDVPDLGIAPEPSEASSTRSLASADQCDDNSSIEATPAPPAVHATSQDRPRGMVSFNIAMSGAEVLFFERCLKTLDRNPSFDDLDDDLKRAFGATPERVLGELQPLSHKEQSVAVSFRFRGKDGDPEDICDITSLNVDIAALAMLIAVAVPSSQPGGFTYTPTGPDYDRNDPRILLLPDGGVVKSTRSTIRIFDTDVPPAHELRQWTFHVP